MLRLGARSDRLSDDGQLRGRDLQYFGMEFGMRSCRKSPTTIESTGNSVGDNLGTADRRYAEFRIQFGIHNKIQYTDSVAVQTPAFTDKQSGHAFINAAARTCRFNQG